MKRILATLRGLVCKPANKTLNDILIERGYKKLDTFWAMFDENAFDGHVGMHYFIKKFDNYAIKISTSDFSDDETGWIIYYFNGHREWGVTKSSIVRYDKEAFLNTIESHAKIAAEAKLKEINKK